MIKIPNLELENGLCLELNNENLTAKVIESPRAKGIIIIPIYIIYQTKNYIIESISKDSFIDNRDVQVIQIPEDSKLRYIEKNAFNRSSVHTITIPPSVEELREGWCKYTSNLEYVFISSMNKNFTYLDSSQNIILGKSDKNSEIFDVLVFASRKVLDNVTIPSTVRYISSYSFNKSSYDVDFEENSSLIKIGKYAFSESLIEKIKIPKHVRTLKEGTFYQCEVLEKVTFEEGSELYSIENDVFAFSNIESLEFPSNVTELHEGWCCEISNLVNIFVSPNNKNFFYLNEKLIIGKSNQSKDNYDTIFFARRDIDEVFIPSFIKFISPYSFADCDHLKSINFTDDSELLLIDKYAFIKASFETITIPRHLRQIEEYSFSFCKNLQSINFTDDTELEIINKFSFLGSSIEKLSIPSTVKELKEGWCSDVTNLIDISISSANKNFLYFDDKLILGKSDSNRDYFDSVLFARRDIKYVEIPSYIKFISSNAFADCKNLLTVKFPDDSNLVSIHKYAFENSFLRIISIPKHLKEIEMYSFSFCKNLKTIKFAVDSELTTIHRHAFVQSSLEYIDIPDKVLIIGEDAFRCCHKLSKINFGKDSQLQKIELDAFYATSIQNIVIPEKMNHFEKGTFRSMVELCTLEFLGEKLTIESNCFLSCHEIFLISFPNICVVSGFVNSFKDVSDECSIFLKPNTCLFTQKHV